MSTAQDVLVTVVIPAKNEEAAIGPCLQSVLSQDYTNLQVIVVDGASDDGTEMVVKQIAADDPRVELIHNEHGLIPISLNRAVDAARGTYLVRIDAHCTVPSDYVGRAIGHLRSGQWAGVGGRKDGVGKTSAGRAIAAAMGSPFGVGNSTYHYGVDEQVVEHIPFGSYPLDVIRGAGGWDERFRVNQDFEFDYRLREAGGKLLFDPQLTIHWECRQSIPDLFTQYKRYGRGKVKVAMRHPRSLRLRHLAAPALVAAAAVAPVVATKRPKTVLAGAAVYGAALAAASRSTAAEVPAADRRWVPAAFLAMHVGWGIGFWQGVAHGLRERSVT